MLLVANVASKQVTKGNNPQQTNHFNGGHGGNFGRGGGQRNQYNHYNNNNMPCTTHQHSVQCQLCGFLVMLYLHVVDVLMFPIKVRLHNRWPLLLPDSQLVYPYSSATNHLTNDINNLSIHSDYNGAEKTVVGNGKGLSISHIALLLFTLLMVLSFLKIFFMFLLLKTIYSLCPCFVVLSKKKRRCK